MKTPRFTYHIVQREYNQSEQHLGVCFTLKNAKQMQQEAIVKHDTMNIYIDKQPFQEKNLLTVESGTIRIGVVLKSGEMFNLEVSSLPDTLVVSHNDIEYFVQKSMYDSTMYYQESETPAMNSNINPQIAEIYHLCMECSTPLAHSDVNSYCQSCSDKIELEDIHIVTVDEIELWLEAEEVANNFAYFFVDLASYLEPANNFNVRLYEQIREHTISCSCLPCIEWR